MSLQKKFEAVALEAAREAMMRERGRVLWCIDQLLRELHGRMRQKLLSQAQLHALNVKWKIVAAFRLQLRRAIISGLSPEGNSSGPPPSASEEPDAPAVTGDPQ